ncbi:MAG: nucleotidyltransferase family protein [Clostridia bacterium]|nr:nucleotidyltransferase family protein [Clostridia bacterium]
MERADSQAMFALLRSTLYGTKLSKSEIEELDGERIARLVAMAKKHDISHLFVLGLKNNGILINNAALEAERMMIGAVYRYENLNYEYQRVCSAFEEEKIPFIPLKGTVLRQYYPEPWMRTSCDMDILIHKEDIDRATKCLIDRFEYVQNGNTPHDVSLFSGSGMHIELHFDLIEEGRAVDAVGILKNVWENVQLHKGTDYQYDMTDEFFYFYHIAHMAKHFENGGCGVRPFIDLWILENIEGADRTKRKELLKKGGLNKFEAATRKVSKVWLEGEDADELSMQMINFVLYGGAYGTLGNRIALRQKRQGGRIGYILSRVFMPYAVLKRYYPVIEKHKWLTPFMQVKRWIGLMKSNPAQKAKHELILNAGVEKDKAIEMEDFLKKLGL